MGKIVVFRSDMRGTARVTSCLAAVAGVLAAESGIRIALLQLPGERNDITEAFDRNGKAGGNERVKRETGLAALGLLLKSGKTDENMIRGCAYRTSLPGIDIFHSNVIGAGTASTGLMGVMTAEISKAYDLVFMDAGTGMVPDADLTVELMGQNAVKWKRHFERMGKGTKTIYAVNGYLNGSSANRRLFTLLYGKKLCCLRMCAGFSDAYNEGNIAGYFKMLRNNPVARFLPDHDFAEDVSRLAGEIMKGVGCEG